MADTAYATIEDRLREVQYLSDSESVLSWDQQVMMPEGGTPARAKQVGTLTRIRHEIVGSDELGEALEAVEHADLGADEQAIVREARRRYDRAAPVPSDFVGTLRETISNAFPVWVEAKESDDFDAFAPVLEELIELRREYAAYIDPDAPPYEVLFTEYEPYLSLDTANEILETLRSELVPLIQAVNDSNVTLSDDIFGGSVDLETQEAISREALDLVGFEWEHGRLDTSAHPFSSGNPFDARITTRYQESEPLDAFTATLHEFGHAQYTLGLDREAYGTPLGNARELTVHESQSRLWENHIGRSAAFWRGFLPRAAGYIPALEQVTTREAYEAANQVYPDNFIRVEADELTYHLHIIIRFEIEQDLIEGTLDVAEIPAVWNDKYESYLGIRPETDAEGCLQDVHWAHGSFGYFPTYSLGSVLAAQIFDALSSDLPDIEDKIESGTFDPIRSWLGEQVHQHGQRYPTPELIEEATGAPYSATPFVEYVTEKYSELYNL